MATNDLVMREMYMDQHARNTRQKKETNAEDDNMTIDRRWMQALFGFDYKIECYVPAAKRVHGYFCLPILWGDRFVGRVDAKADRKAKALLIRKLIFEPQFGDYDAVWPPLAEKMRAFATFNGCESVVVEDVDPTRVKVAARQALDSA